MQPSFTVRPLRTRDAAEASGVHAQAFAAPWSEDDIRDQTARPDRVLTGAWQSGKLASFAASRYVGDEADLLTIVVDAGHRREGIGTGLLARHLSALSERKVCVVFLEVAADNIGARAFYAKLGFASVGERKGYYPGAGHTRGDAVVMRCAL